MTTPQEARNLASVLAGMIECGPAPDDLWERDQPDGDPFVARAAEILKEHADLLERQAQPVAWTLRETLDSKQTTTRGLLWFSNPKNSAWAPLYVAPQPDEIAAAVAAERDRIAKSAERWGLARQPEYGGTSLMNFASELRAGWA